jgi:MFS superfamily sulfate permease-like transporter
VRVPALFSSLRGYRGEWLRSDLLAGLTVWAILIPESLAYASIAGVSPVVGLYAAPGALVLYAALGSSRVLVVGPMAATAASKAATATSSRRPGDDRQPRRNERDHDPGRRPLARPGAGVTAHTRTR